MTISLTHTRAMLAALEIMKTPRTFLLDTFFKEESRSNTDTVDIDIVKYKTKLAPFVAPDRSATLVERTGYTTKSIKLPYIKEKTKCTAMEILQREVGQHIYMPGASPMDRATRELNKELTVLQNMIIRREEWMAAQAINSGKIAISGDGVNAEVDFGLSATHLDPTVNPKWGETNADPLGDLVDWAALIEEDAGLSPDIAIMGNQALEKFLKDTTVQKYMDMLRVNMGEIKPQELPSGASYVGFLRYPGLMIDVYGYRATYTDTNGSVQYFVPEKKVWLLSSQARFIRQYGAIYDVEFGSTPVRWFPKTWKDEDPSQYWLMLQSAPLPSPLQIDAIVSATVLS